MRAIFSLCCLLAGCLLGSELAAAVPQARFGTPDQQVARNTAERVYSTWRLGMMRGDENAWRGATTRSRQMKVRNLFVSL